MEDSVTVTSVLNSWNYRVFDKSTVLGVSTLAYFPYAVFNYVSPLMSVLIAVIGYKIKRSITDTSSDEN
jgi:NhaC family Na+:H+ antiporter